MYFMEYFTVPVWFILVICLFILLYIYSTSPGKFWPKHDVPSPPSAPFIGHMHKIYDPNLGLRGCLKAWTEKYGGVYGVLFFRFPVLIVTEIEPLKQIFVKDFNNFVDHFLLAEEYLWHPLMRKALFFNHGEDWRRIRRIISPLFSTGKLKQLTHHINLTAKQLTEALESHVDQGTHPVAKVVFSAFSVDVLAGTAFGLELDSQNNINNSFYQESKALVAFPSSLKYVLSVTGAFPILGNIFKMLGIGYMKQSTMSYFEKHLTAFINERKDTPEQFETADFLQFLINAEADENEEIVGSKKLTTEEIVAQGINFILAGYEATSSSLQWMSYELASRKDIQVKMREEIEAVVGNGDVQADHCNHLPYIEAVINETLRMYPAIASLSRKVVNDTTIKGFKLPAGSGVIIPVANILRDPQIFKDPDTFNPDRFLDEKNKVSTFLTQLPLGSGPRQCIGMRLAMLQLKICLVHMVRVVTIEDVYPRNVGIDDTHGLLVPKKPIHLVLSKYTSK